jgi:peroxiredoxin
MARNISQIGAILLICGSIACWSGCQKRPQTESTKPPEREHTSMSATWTAKQSEKEDSSATAKEAPITSEQSKTKPPSPPLTIPKVGLTDALHATCLVNEGDTFPAGQLVAPEGNSVSLPSQYGKKLTVLFFWAKDASRYDQLIANSALQDLQADVAEPYQEKGVRVIGIQVGGGPETSGQQFEKSGAKFPHYYDPDGAFFRRVAREKLPRLYLLDAAGKIIWFDVEYSRAARRNLLIAIQVALGEK